MTSYTPLELEKLCYNKIVEYFYNEHEYIFSRDIQKLELPDNIFKNLIERYRIIRHITEVERLQIR